MHNTRSNEFEYQKQAKRNLVKAKEQEKGKKFKRVKILRGFAYKEVKE